MNHTGKWYTILLRIVSYLLVACAASLMTLWLFVPKSDAGMVKLQQLSQLIHSNFIGQLDDTALYDAAAAGMVAGTSDRWSYYISADQMEDYNSQKDNVYMGVGITIQERTDGKGADILRVEPNGSAWEQGVLPGDILYMAQGQLVSELGVDGISKIIKGEEGTTVQITVLRDDRQLEFTLTRRQILTEVASGQMMEGNIGYIRINNFNANCASQSIAQVDGLLEEGATALIFDVRYNGGGYKTELVKLLDHLLPEGKIFISQDYTGQTEEDMSDDRSVDVPMVVLVNGSSYSAAEFFAAALSEYEKAKIVGLPTTGKGYFQSTYTLSDGSAVALSIGKYFTPKGVSLAEVGGLTPDVIVEVDEQTANGIYSQTLPPEEDPQIQAAMELLK